MTDAPFPLLYEGGGKFIAPSTFFCNRADERFKEGERYQMVEHHDRSANSHRHYFASIYEAWMNLPEAEAPKYPDSETLRKRALIFTGWRNETITVCASEDHANRLAALIESLDPFAVVIVRDNTVTTLRAKSQSQKAMGKADFQKSKDDVLAWCWKIVGVDPETGNANAGASA